MNHEENATNAPPTDIGAPQQETQTLIETPDLLSWQNKLLPLMRGVIILVTLFFLAATVIQLYFLQGRIGDPPKSNLDTVLNTLQYNQEDKAEEKIKTAKFKVISMLEENAVARRYHQANVMLMARVWIIYLGFVTGMILSLVGATFILGKLREASATLGVDGIAGEFSLQTASPGLILSLLGTILMLTTMIARPEIQVTDVPLYMSDGLSSSGDTADSYDNVINSIEKEQESEGAEKPANESKQPAKKSIRSYDEILSDIDKDRSQGTKKPK
jgi:hypothetical protein